MMSSHADAKPMASHLPVGRTWIVVASQTQARIFRYLGLKSGLELVEKIQHPEGRLRNSELASDRQGKVHGGDGFKHGSYSEQVTPHQEVAIDFARRLAHQLSAARGRNEFDALMLVAEAGFLGKLKSALDAQTTKHVVATLDREFHQKSSSELSRHLTDYLVAG